MRPTSPTAERVLLLRNLWINFRKRGYGKTMLSKLVKRLEPDSRHAAREWAASHHHRSIAEYCASIDSDLWEEAELASIKLKQEADMILRDIPVDLGGGGAHPLLYFLVRRHQPTIIFETGVAAGWSSASIISACEKNKVGMLFSSDFPYFRLANPEQYIGILVSSARRASWHLDMRGDATAIPHFLSILENRRIDLLHYDSDKSYSGREFVLNQLAPHLADDAVLIIDDIQDNLQFKDFVTKRRLSFEVFEFEGKFIGLVPSIGRQLGPD